MLYSSKSLKLYEDFSILGKSKNLKVPAAHKSLFEPNDLTRDYINTLYVQQLGRDHLINRPSDSTCNYCEKFHLENQKNIDKEKDIGLGKTLEDCFQEFIEAKFESLNIKIKCMRADTEKKNMPDFKIVREKDNKVLFYFEFKAIFRPYLKIKNIVDKNFECYSHSLTLDLSNGKKLQTQREFVENDLGVDNVYYVYWYDLPCVKGIYWLPSEQVYNIMDYQIPYNREVSKGDFNKSGKKIGSTNKLYLPLNKMADFGTFMRHIYNLYNK